MSVKDTDTELSADLLRGADEIAKFIFGDKRERRRIYYLAGETKSGAKLPVFRLGAVLCARKSTLMQWIAARERPAA